MLAVPTAIVGIYEMNFVHMPDLGWTLGYPLVVGVMAASLAAIFRAFQRSSGCNTPGGARLRG